MVNSYFSRNLACFFVACLQMEKIRRYELSMISHYENHVYCMKMGHWIKKTDVTVLKSGRLTCPLHHGRVRLKPRASCRNRTLKRKINVVNEMCKMERKEILNEA